MSEPKDDSFDDLIAPLMQSAERSLTLLSAPHDPELWNVAEQRMGHIDLKHVSDEYDRLILEKYGPK